MENNPFRPISAKVVKFFRETASEFTLRVEAAADITPGQFFQVSLPKVGEAPISVSRYSESWIEFTIRAAGKLTNVIQDLKVGQNLFIRGPYGKGFELEKFRNKDLIIVSGGSGVAPVKPLIEHAMSGVLGVKSLKLIAGFKNAESILFADEVKEWGNKCDLCLTIDKPEDRWSGKTGLVTEYIRKLQINDMKNVEVVVVGPPMMMKFSTAEFLLLGVPAEKIWVSFERLMSCGIGKCGHCKIDYTYVCVDGPVLNFTHASTLID
jgi:anaerobic sulfite reductase subunit B